MKEILMVFLGGGAGSVLRYLISAYSTKGGALAYHTLCVNVVGSLVIGVVVTALSKNPTHLLIYLLSIGFCGGFTTFSTFSLELFGLIKSGNLLMALLYIVLSIFCSLGALYLGYCIAK